MIILRISENDGNQRLDRFLKKYLDKASLSYIYRLIRKDVKINGKRGKNNTILLEGDEVKIYVTEDSLKEIHSAKKAVRIKKQFKIVYEDENILVVNKPFGLLTHGGGAERKNTLANQVLSYLIAKGDYIPRIEKTFVPAPANRLDRNTTGLVIFGKNAVSLKEINRKLRKGENIEKYYIALVSGELKETLKLEGAITKLENANRVEISEEGREAKTLVYPVMSNHDFSLAEIKLLTGRPHQIRAHLAAAGYPVVGDRKYGNSKINAWALNEFKLKGQFLHAYKLVIDGKIIEGELPQNMEAIKKKIFNI